MNEDDSLSPTEQAALSYLSTGISVLPIRPPVGEKRLDAKPAIPEWKSLQSSRATSQMVQAWFHGSDLGVGIIGGAVSGNLVIMDVDDAPFSAWLEAAVMGLLSRTWVVKTGSGRLHVFLRSRMPTKSTILKRSSRKLADIRAEGEYVVAPPSIHSLGELYRTLCGDPAHIALVDDAIAIFNRLADAYAGAMAPPEPDAARYGDLSWDPPLDPTARAALMHEMDVILGGHTSRRLISGEETADNSVRDWSFINEMIERGMSDQTIEQIYATFPVGLATYRNGGRSNHGKGYLYRTLDRARASQARREDAASSASGVNFQVLQVKRMQFEDPIYEIQFINDLGEEQSVSAEHDDMYVEMRFLKRIGRKMQGIPRLQLQHRGKGYLDFADLLLRMAKTEDVPTDATVMGHLRRFIVGYLKRPRSLAPEPPEVIEGTTLGWRDEKEGMIYVRGNVLINAIALQIRPAPGPERVWNALRFYGGRQRSFKYTNGVKEQVWTLPIEVLGEE